MIAQVTAFRSVPDFAQGFVKDLRVRWALEEAGWPYEQVLIDGDVQASDAYRRWQPFAQVPAYRDEDVELFESGAIVLHIAGRSEALAPPAPSARARVTAWVFAALNSVEPSVENVVTLDLFYEGEPWVEGRRPSAVAMLNQRLHALTAWLGAKPYLEDRFTAGDLMMTTVLRNLREHDSFSKFPTLEAYVQRCESRPAFARALEAQLAVFRAHL